MAAKIDRLGETRMMNCGMEATIIQYKNAMDIDVRFEDGSMVEHKAYGNFKRGGIVNPNIRAFVKDRLGETRMMNCGMEATIIRYESAKDMDVCFKDGAIVEHRKYDSFKRGEIANPNMKVSAKNRLGETRMMNCGMKATIIRYGNNGDIDVRFEDRTIAKRKGYGDFKKGGIANPNIKTSAENRLGETWMMNCGMEATIIRYGGCNDIDVRFEDGAVAKHKLYDPFKKSKIAHPSISQKDGSKDFHGFICKHCGLEDVLTPQEMIEHEKLEHGKNK